MYNYELQTISNHEIKNSMKTNILFRLYDSKSTDDRLIPFIHLLVTCKKKKSTTTNNKINFFQNVNVSDCSKTRKWPVLFHKKW